MRFGSYALYGARDASSQRTKLAARP